MTEKEAIHKLAMFVEFFGGDELLEACRLGMAAMMDKTRSPWTATEDRYPPTSGGYWCCQMCGEVPFYGELRYDSTDNKFYTLDDDGARHVKTGIVAWQPLPKPYKRRTKPRHTLL